MSDTNERIAAHYTRQGGLYDRICAILAEAGIAEHEITAAHLAAIDEFHIGGREATVALLDPLDLAPGTRTLDLGSGIGGPARLMATRYGARVTGLDLTPDFVETARRLTERLGVAAEFRVGSALDLPFEDEDFELVTLIHVGMNLPDKARLFAEAARVLVPGGRFAVYDVMRLGAHPAFPLPWSEAPETSFLEAPEAYLDAASAAGLVLLHREERGAVARDFFARMQARLAEAGPPVLGLPVLMGESAGQKAANMRAAVDAGDIAPVEMIFLKPETPPR